MQNRQSYNHPTQSCVEVQEQFFSLMEGLLSPSEEAQLRTHFDTCVECSTAWAQYRALEQRMFSAREAIPSAGDLSAGFYQKLEQQQRKPVRRFRWLVASPAFAMLVLGVLVWQGKERQSTPSLTSPASTIVANAPAPTKTLVKPDNTEVASSDTSTEEAPLLSEVAVPPTVRAKATHHHVVKLLKEAKSPVVVAMLNDTPPPDGVDLVVTDNERGFENRVHIEGEDTSKHGVRTVTIEDEEPTTAPTFAVEKSSE